MKKIMILLTMIVLMSMGALAANQTPGTGTPTGTPLDNDNDGIPNYEDEDFVRTYENQVNAQDDDGDGIPNGQDEDYVPAGDGRMAEFQNKMQELRQSGTGAGEGAGDGAGAGDGSGARIGASGAIEGMKMMNQYTDSEFGRKVSEFAKSYENKNNQALQYEEKIQSRSGFSKFFMGGDRETANQLKEQVGSNNQEIAQLRNELANANAEEAEVIEGQIQKLQQECDRLGQVADAESKKKGMFRWW